LSSKCPTAFRVESAAPPVTWAFVFPHTLECAGVRRCSAWVGSGRLLEWRARWVVAIRPDSPLSVGGEKEMALHRSGNWEDFSTRISSGLRPAGRLSWHTDAYDR